MTTRLSAIPGIVACALFAPCLGNASYATGTWAPLAFAAPGPNAGCALLLSDGTVICMSDDPGSDGIGKLWHRLTPDSQGSYVNGKWSSIAPMHDTRLYFSSQVLMNGRVYVAGGEYGSGGAAGEVYDPLTNVWTSTPSPGGTVSDANSEILPDGRVLQALLIGSLKTTAIYNPVTNSYSPGPSCLGIHNESVWMKLQDQSILFVDRLSTASERYIPALNAWVADSTVPVQLYDPFGSETGAALRLPDGRAFFMGSPGTTAYYTPSGTPSPGVWAAGPAAPSGKGAPDAPMAMMANGKILCVLSPVPTNPVHFPQPASFYEFDYLTNSFTQIGAPSGGLTVDAPSYVFNLLDLPDGSVLCMRQGSTQYHIYSPDGLPLAAGKPTISTVARTGPLQYALVGTLFNGISEGASYGDDWQMNTNYPIVRLTSTATGSVYYARTFDWNSTGVATGSMVTTTKFTLPPALPYDVYSLVVTANGIASDAVSLAFTNPACTSDLNASGAVDGADLGMLLSNWSDTGVGDLNGDGTVDGADLGVLLAAWGQCP